MFGNAYSASFTPGAIVGRGVDGYPIHAASFTPGSIVGYSKDGFPIHAAASPNPVSILATCAFVASGVALGWLLTGSAIEFFKK